MAEAPALAVSQQRIDEILCSGGDKPDNPLRICAHFNKDKPLEQNAAFLKKEYGTGGRGFYFGTDPVAVWYDETGLYLAPGKQARCG